MSKTPEIQGPDTSAVDFRLVFESAPGLCLVLLPDLRIAAVSDAYLQATMTEREIIQGRGIFEIFPDNPDEPAADGVRNLRASLERVLQSGKPDTMAVQKYDIRRPEAEGGGFEERYWSPVNAPAMGPDGEVRYVIHTVTDVTEFVHQDRLRSEREKDSEGPRARPGSMEAEIYVRSKELGEANRQLRSVNEGLIRLHSQVAELATGAERRLMLQSRTGNLGERPLTPEETVERVAQLVTAQHNLEDQLRQSQKMEAIGRLAGGVAHDFNNLLTVITGQASLAGEELGSGKPAERMLEIQKAADRAAAMTKQLLTFSRKQILQPRILDCNAIVADMENMLRRLIRSNISFMTLMRSGLGKIRADRGQVEQVIMNLVVNARDAMPNGGRLVIETNSAEVAFPGQISALAKGLYTVIAVVDTGHGIDPITAERIFEPFFTTREPGKGTGLGLSTVHGIVEQSGGAVVVESKPGEGTTFRVYLPAVEGAADDNQEPKPVLHVQRTPGFILIVEDESDVRKLIAQILTRAGHRVMEAANGEEALRLAQGSRIDLMLTDVMMPGISGPELAERLRTIYSGMNVLFTSGYDRDQLEKHNVAGARFLPKPFTPEGLLSGVAELLGARPGRLGTGSRDSSVA